MPDAAGGGAVEFSLDLYFGANTETVLAITPMISYNSKKIDVIGLSNIVSAGLAMPNPSPNKPTDLDTPPTITVDHESVISDADKVTSIGWVDMHEISEVAGATIAKPVRLVTIAFKWKAGATGNSHIGITQSNAGSLDGFHGAGITVQGTRDAKVAARTENIDVTAGAAALLVECVLSRAISAETTCALEHGTDSTAVLDGDYIADPAIQGATIVIPADKTSGARIFLITPFAPGDGKTISIALRTAIANGAPIAIDDARARIPLISPQVLVSKSTIVTKEAGGRVRLLVRLATQPMGGDVLINVRSTEIDEATVSPASLRFTADNWNTPQRVLVWGVDDNHDDGDKRYTIQLVADENITGATNYRRKSAFVSGTTIDDDEAKMKLTADSVYLSKVDGERRIVITAEFDNEVTFEYNTRVTLRNARGSATAIEGTDYENLILPSSIITAGGVERIVPNSIMIPAGQASASATFSITMLGTDTAGEKKTIIIAGAFLPPVLTPKSLILTISKYDLDVDASGGGNARDAVTGQDGILIMRYLLGVRGPALTYGQTNLSPATIAARIEACMDALDVDDNGETDRIDGTLLARYLLGLRGRPLVDGIDYPIEADPPKPADVADAIEKLLPE
ncbi:MAG: hypothetical protein OD918_03255 [Gammaproteobacteria bacterium]